MKPFTEIVPIAPVPGGSVPFYSRACGSQSSIPELSAHCLRLQAWQAKSSGSQPYALRRILSGPGPSGTESCQGMKHGCALSW